MSARDAFDPDALELRVLSGRHAGARVDASEGLSVGADESADVVLSDLDPALGPVRLTLGPQGRWSLRPQGDGAGAEVGEGLAGIEQARHGVVRRLGGLALSVAPARSDWPSVPPHEEPSEPVLLDDAALGPSLVVGATASTVAATTEAGEAGEGGAAPSVAVLPVAAPAGRLQRLARSPAGIAAAVVAVAAIALLLSFGSGARAPVAAGAGQPAPVDAAAQQRQVRDIQLAIARVDPSLRLQVQPLPDGRVRVGGWVGSTAEWDRLAEALGGLRPMPVMQVREVGELRDELRNRLGPEMAAMEFETAGAAGLRVKGLVAHADDRTRALASLRELLPNDVELIDGLELAEKQAPAFASALRAAGFADANALWDGEQVLASLRLSPPERGRLEQALAQLAQRFRGLHFTVDAQPAPIATTAGASPLSQVLRGAPANAVPMARAGLPFQIRSVVGGAAPFVLLDDGNRLVVGGSAEGWRLQAVEADYLLFDGPRRVAVLR